MSALDREDEDGFGVVMTVAIARDAARWSARLGRDIRPELEPMNAMIASVIDTISATQYVDALDAMSTWSREISAWWDDYDVLVLPTSPLPPVKLGELAPENLENLGLMARLVGFTSPFDLTGQPAISLPLHWNADGLPIGVQLVARYGREDVLLRVAAQLEAAQPWSERTPPVFA